MRKPAGQRGVGASGVATVARWSAVALLTAIATTLGVFLLANSDERAVVNPAVGGAIAGPPASTGLKSPSDMTAPSGAADVRTVTERLEEIFAIQDRAFRDRDDRLLRSVFAADCPCLRAGRERIRRLREDGLRWVGYRSRLSAVRADPAAAGSWSVSAVVSATRTQVETEERELLRIIPPGSLRWTFVLAPPPNGGPLLLRDAEARR